jgi:hypothetical protein
MNIDALRTVIKNDPPRDLVQELAPNSSKLRSLHTDFRRVADRIQFLSVFETQRTPTVIFDVSSMLHSNLSTEIFVDVS